VNRPILEIFFASLVAYPTLVSVTVLIVGEDFPCKFSGLSAVVLVLKEAFVD